MSTIASVVQPSSSSLKNCIDDYDKFESLTDTVDTCLERVDNALDDLRGINKKRINMNVSAAPAPNMVAAKDRQFGVYLLIDIMC